MAKKIESELIILAENYFRKISKLSEISLQEFDFLNAILLNLSGAIKPTNPEDYAQTVGESHNLFALGETMLAAKSNKTLRKIIKKLELKRKSLRPHLFKLPIVFRTTS